MEYRWIIRSSSLRKGKFSLSEKVIPIILKDNWKEIVDMQYLKIMIESAAIREGFNFNKKAGKSRLALLEIDLPITIDGIVDLEAQKEYVNKYINVNTIKDTLNNYKEVMDKSTINIPISSKYKEVKLGDKINGEPIFKLTIGKRVLKKDILDSGVPVYSANVMKPFGYILESNLEEFNQPSLIWGIDGNFQWNYIDKDFVFASTDYCGRLIVNHKLIHPQFLYYQLLEGQGYYGFNRSFRASLKNIGEVSIDIPIDINGEFDLDIQKELASKFQKVYNIKYKLCDTINNLTEKSIEI